MRITFISHAPTIAIRRAAFPLDESLERSELLKVKALQWCTPRSQHIVCAPEQRTSQTAAALGLTAAIDADLRDCDYGGWGGLELSQLQETIPNDVAEWLTEPSAAPHGGESIRDVVLRVRRWLEGQSDSAHIIAVTHPAIIRGAIVTALTAPHQAFWRIDIPPLTLTELRHNGRAWSVRAVGCSLNHADDKD